jgi:hypothetical protein
MLFLIGKWRKTNKIHPLTVFPILRVARIVISVVFQLFPSINRHFRVLVCRDELKIFTGVPQNEIDVLVCRERKKCGKH